MTWDYSLTRRQARILRRLAEAYLAQLERQLPTLSPATPPEPGQRERPYVRCRLTIDDVKLAIKKLRRIETT
jgi:hypothetical protein